MTEPRTRRSYSGKVTAIIVVTIVVVFVLLNVMSSRLVPQPDRPGVPPSVTVKTAVPAP